MKSRFLPRGERVVDRLDVVARVRNEEVVDRDRAAGRLPRGPGRAGGVGLRGGDEDVEVPVRVDVEERLLAAAGRRGERRVRRVREALRGRALHAREDLVPDGVRPAVEVLLRTRYCCCEPLITVLPVKSESEMKPPLANDGPVQKSIRVVSPSTCTRRIGAACETAQNSAAPRSRCPSTLIVRFDSDRQKFVSAVQKSARRIG